MTCQGGNDSNIEDPTVFSSTVLDEWLGEFKFDREELFEVLLIVEADFADFSVIYNSIDEQRSSLPDIKRVSQLAEQLAREITLIPKDVRKALEFHSNSQAGLDASVNVQSTLDEIMTLGEEGNGVSSTQRPVEITPPSTPKELQAALEAIRPDPKIAVRVIDVSKPHPKT